MLDTLHRLVPVRLFLDKDRVCLERPLKSPEVSLERLEESIGVLRRNARNVPLSNESSSRIDETHREVLYTYVDA